MIVIKGAQGIQLDPSKVWDTLDIVIDEGIITAAHPGAADELTDVPERVIDASGLTAMPGMVCSHHHYYSALSRGIIAPFGPMNDFISILKELWWRVDRVLDEEAVFLSSLVSSIEAISRGTTSVIDHHASPSCIAGSLDAVRRGFEEAGLRGMTCYEVTDRNGGIREAAAGIEENLSFISRIDRERQSGTWSGLMEAAVGAHAPFTLDDACLELLADAVRRTGRGLHIHVAEDAYDVSCSHHRHGVDCISRLDDRGLLDSRSLLVHGVHLSREEISTINSRDAFLIHNVRSNMNNRVGYQHHIGEAANLALGTDGIGADMFEELKFAYFKHRDAGGDLGPDHFTRALSGGNEILSRYWGRQFGRLEAGCAADIILCGYRSPAPLTAENIPGHLVFGMDASSVHTVVINGRVVMEDRTFPFDVDAVYAEARSCAASMWKRMESLRP